MTLKGWRVVKPQHNQYTIKKIKERNDRKNDKMSEECIVFV